MKAAPKPFQLATIDRICSVLLDKRTPRRFLVADEPGLGKTVLAREAITQYHEKVKKRLRGRPLVIYYITSDLGIAHQNRGRLVTTVNNPRDEKLVSSAERLGLIPTTPRLAGPVELFALTPATSFPEQKAKAGPGRGVERAILYRLLKSAFLAQVRRLPDNAFQLGVGDENWRQALIQAEAIVRNLPARFKRIFKTCVKDEFGGDVDLLTAAGDRGNRHKVLVRLRRAMSLTSLRCYPPDLVILDEFQKYRYVIDEALKDPAVAMPDPLIKSLFDGSGHKRPAILMLSGTPHPSKEENGHHLLFKLLAFLKNDKAFADSLNTEFESLRLLLQGIAKSVGDQEKQKEMAAQAKMLRDSIQSKMTQVMARSERDLIKQNPGQAQFAECPVTLSARDLEVYANFVKVLDEGDYADAIKYWDSIPYPAQAMGPRYAAWKRKKKNKVLKGPAITAVRVSSLAKLGELAHHKMRAVSAIAQPSHLALPWVPPSFNWWPLRGPWKGARKDIKLLLFTRFKAAPQSIASLLSYGVESAVLKPGENIYSKVSKVSKFKTGKKQFPLFSLFYPSPFLIEVTDPYPVKSSEPIGTLRKRIERQLLQYLDMDAKRKKLTPAKKENEEASARKKVRVVFDGPAKARRQHRSPWYVLAGIERHLGYGGRAAAAWEDIAKQDASVQAMLTAWKRVPAIDSISPRELQDLVEHALLSPGVVLGRALYRHFPEAVAAGHLKHLVGLSWGGLRTYLDKPIFWALYPGKSANDAVKQAVYDGCLESVLDEHFWMRSTAVSGGVKEVVKELLGSLQLGAGSFKFHSPGAKNDGKGKGIRLRCHVAVPFGGLETEKQQKKKAGSKANKHPADMEGRAMRSDVVRGAFNTPFWPHVVASTSVGQEGLDFHTWCSRIGHWDICPGPVEIEQREGRVSRFAGLVIRNALAKEMEINGALLENTKDLPALLPSAWRKVEGLAKEDGTGLQPWWQVPGSDIQRYRFSLDLSRDEQKFGHLQSQRMIYRLALGHPNQHDLIRTLSVDDEQTLAILQSLVLNLSPFGATSQSER